MTSKPAFTFSGQWGLAALPALLCLAAALVLGRPDIAALSLPLVALAAAGIRARGGGPVAVKVIEAPQQDLSGFRKRFSVHSSGPDAAVVVQATAPGHKPLGIVISTGAQASFEADVPLSGRAVVLSNSASAQSFDSVVKQPPASLGDMQLTVLPTVQQAAGLPLPLRLRGLTGEHRSRLPGDGGELRDIYPFQPGDQLRRIDWRATAKQSSDQDRIHVRRTFANSEANVHLLIDHAFDLPVDTAHWFDDQNIRIVQITSLHLTREAAALVAASYLNSGDRVGMNELSGLRRPLRAAAGRRQLELIRTRLANVSAKARGDRALRDVVVPAGALVYVFSPFLDEDPLRSMRTLAGVGHRVIGVDTLPELTYGAGERSQQITVALMMVQRRHVLEQLTAEGMPVLGWRGAHTGAGRAPAPDDGSIDSVAGQLPLERGLATVRRNFSRAHHQARA